LLPSRPSYRALYLQVRDALAERISRREWRAGHAVPNESDLARELGVSPGTVRKALDLMEAQRLITRRQGKGTFVNDQTSDAAAARFSKLRGAGGEPIAGSVGPVAISEATADEQEAARLRLRVSDPVYRISRHRRDRRQNFMAEYVTLPAALFPGLTDSSDIGGDISGLAHHYGILLGRAEERISLAVPPASIAGTLGVAQGMPLMQLDRVIFTFDGRAVEWRMAYCHLPGSYYLAEIS
jgi:GntR family transcriptional regulator